jgi:hypothetical protein
MDLTLIVHNDIEDAAEFFNIPIVLCGSEYVYVMQEDRCVFVGNYKTTPLWMGRNEGKFCESRFK